MGNRRGIRSLLAGLVVAGAAMATHSEVQAQDIPEGESEDAPGLVAEEKPVPVEASPSAPEPVDPDPAAPVEPPAAPAEPPAAPAEPPPPPPPATTSPVPVSPPADVTPPVSKEEKEAAARQRLIELIKEVQSQKRRPKGPFGTRLYATPNLDLSIGYASPAGLESATSYTRYVDRGGYLPQLISIILQAWGAQAEANQAGHTIERDIYVGTSVGMNIELYGLEKDELDGAVYDLYWIIADEDKKFPTVFNFGFTLGSMGMEAGLLGEAIIPLASRFNVEVGGRIGVGESWYQLNLAGVGNITDRFYGRAAYQYAEDLGSGYVASLGVRL